ncbi:hypothetical protein EI555_008295, partial [Monodon monoceros]
VAVTEFLQVSIYLDKSRKLIQNPFHRQDEAEHIAGQRQQKVVIQDEHFELVQFAEGPRLDGTDVIVVGLEVLEALEAQEGVLPQHFELVVVEVQPLEGFQAAERPGSDLLQPVVTQVESNRVGVIDELVGVQSRQEVAIEEKLIDSILGGLEQADSCPLDPGVSQLESICKMGISAGARKGQALPLVGMGEMRQQKQGERPRHRAGESGFLRRRNGPGAVSSSGAVAAGPHDARSRTTPARTVPRPDSRSGGGGQGRPPARDPWRIAPSAHARSLRLGLWPRKTLVCHTTVYDSILFTGAKDNHEGQKTSSRELKKNNSNICHSVKKAEKRKLKVPVTMYVLYKNLNQTSQSLAMQENPANA